MKHLTQRVAWHDQAWNGTVCAAPSENSFCIALDRIHKERVDDYEEGIALERFDELDSNDLPPCRAEGGAFMSPRPWTRTVTHPYQENKNAQATHGHLRPTEVTVPAHATFAIPFDWLRREAQDDIAAASPDRLPEDQEPPFPTAWVFGRNRQRRLLDMFFAPIVPGGSLVFYYTKEGQPISDAISRLVVGVGLVTHVAPTLEYESVGSKATPPIWEHLVHHSIRADGSDGFLLPYHAYLDPTGDAKEDARRRELLREVAVTPDPAHTKTFSYFSEHASPDVALSTLVRCLEAVRAIRRHRVAEGSWEAREEWLNEQIARTWRDRGAFPGLGSALEALGLRLGTALSLELIAGGHVDSAADPWPVVDAILRGEHDPPQPAYRGDIEAVRPTWAKLTEERRSLIELLSRFAVSPKQAKRWFEVKHRNAATSEPLTDRQIIENPYRIAECDLGTLFEPAVGVGVIDRGLFPDDTVAVACPVPEPSRTESASDFRRVRAAAVTCLRRAADDGDSLLSAVEVLTRFERLDLAKPCVVPLDWFPGHEEFLAGVIRRVEVEVPASDGPTMLAVLQLEQHARTEQKLGKLLLKASRPSSGQHRRGLAQTAHRGDRCQRRRSGRRRHTPRGRPRRPARRA
ncbi:MAG: hypothetical protein WKF96_04555 [Solirubrobacteraceae bacterium]